MPLIVEGGRVPPRWAEQKSSRPAGLGDGFTSTGCVRIAFINNMPDSALEDTEVQFFELLDAASGNIPVLLGLYSLTGVPRGERGQQHLNSFYFGTNDLLNSRFEAVIMTGTEPRQAQPAQRTLLVRARKRSGLGGKQYDLDDLVMFGGTCRRLA